MPGAFWGFGFGDLGSGDLGSGVGLLRGSGLAGLNRRSLKPLWLHNI